MVEFIKIPVSIGELIDKITILEIKAAQLTDATKRSNVETELSLLDNLRKSTLPESTHILALMIELKTVNERIWDLEDALHDCERRQDFGSQFAEIARATYRANDERAAIKRRINIAFGSRLMEEKSHEPY